MDNWGWAVLLLGIGAILVVLEFFIPSAGVIGVTAAICLVSAIVIGYLDGPVIGTIILAVEVIGVPIVLTAMVRLWPHTPIGRRLFLPPPESKEVVAYQEKRESLSALVGQRGVARSKMLPSGVVRIEGRTYDAVADGDAIEAGETVIVKGIQMNCLVVRRERSDFVAPSIAESADVLQRSLEELGLDDPTDNGAQA